MYKNVLVPVAFDHERDVQEALGIAKAIAEEGAKITALHVMEDVPAYVVQYLPEGRMEENVKEIERRMVAELACETNVGTAIATGHAGHAIVDYAKQHGVDCIVVASHRPGFTDFFLGSTAARVVRHAPCAVHVSR